ncbi:putative ribonuclease H-like domain-containing protein [Tanacetum coccineum]|uniref:Ribonuclease H-like domain-containing protein n=1 Tax=Tanacetum coccineum TaxID=301880 RepID=A0ABQ5CIB8_9ASTR
MMEASPVFLLSKASSTKSWLWHRRLNHLNFRTLNELAQKYLVRGLPKLKYEKEHLCPSCQLGKSKKSSHPLKTVNTNAEVLNTLYMDLCGPRRVESINGKKYILVIVDDYTRFEAPMFLWVEVVATVCYTLNRSLVHTLHEKTYYELLKGKKPEVKYFHVFGSLCYPTNDYDDLGKLKAKADIGIFVGYAPTKKAYRIYNKRTHKIQETIHVTFDELTQGMTSIQPSTGLGPNSMAPGHNEKQLSKLFQPLFDEDKEFPPDVHPHLVNVAPPRAPDITLDSPSSTTVTEDSPAATTITSPSQTSPPNTGVNRPEHIITTSGSESFENSITNEFDSEASSSGTVNVNPTQQNNPPIVHEQKWTKDHPLENVIGDLNLSVSTRRQLETNVMWCFFIEFLENVEPKNFKKADYVGLQDQADEYGEVMKKSSVSGKRFSFRMQKIVFVDPFSQLPNFASVDTPMVGDISEIGCNAYQNTLRLWFCSKSLADADYAELSSLQQKLRSSTMISASLHPKEQVENRVVEVFFVESKYRNLSDLFTKCITRERFELLLPLLGMKQLSPKTLRELQDSAKRVM